MGKLPKDCNARVIGAEARKLVHYKFPSENWEYHELTGRDNGLDCTIELIENGEFTNKKIEGQIKGTKEPKLLKVKNVFSLEIDIKTILYGLSSPNAFVVFLVDVINEEVYYLPLQDFFISNISYFDKLENNKKTINIHIPCDNKVSEEDFDLQQIAKSIYVGGPSKELHKSE
ncbi:MAG: DUF4365 domain-containing protein [Acutalibacteraceae bacterium]|nr:DUF4365 domain-containing protein [Acutalibacteraceae bacterium]